MTKREAKVARHFWRKNMVRHADGVGGWHYVTVDWRDRLCYLSHGEAERLAFGITGAWQCHCYREIGSLYSFERTEHNGRIYSHKRSLRDSRKAAIGRDDPLQSSLAARLAPRIRAMAGQQFDETAALGWYVMHKRGKGTARFGRFTVWPISETLAWHPKARRGYTISGRLARGRDGSWVWRTK